MPNPKQNLPANMTVVEAVEKLEEFRQRIIDERYEDLVEEGEVDTPISVEVMEAIDVLLYYIDTMSQLPEEDMSRMR